MMCRSTASVDRCISILGPPSEESPQGDELSLIFKSRKVSRQTRSSDSHAGEGRDVCDALGVEVSHYLLIEHVLWCSSYV